MDSRQTLAGRVVPVIYAASGLGALLEGLDGDRPGAWIYLTGAAVCLAFSIGTRFIDWHRCPRWGFSAFDASGLALIAAAMVISPRPSPWPFLAMAVLATFTGWALARLEVTVLVLASMVVIAGWGDPGADLATRGLLSLRVGVLLALLGYAVHWQVHHFERATEQMLAAQTDAAEVRLAAEQAEQRAVQARHDDVSAVLDQLRMLAEKMPSAVFLADERGEVTFHNTGWSTLVGDRRSRCRVELGVHVDDRARVLDVIGRLDGQDQSVTVRSCDGARVLELHLGVVGGELGAGGSIVGSVDDITDELELMQRAEEDPLTNARNRRAIDRELEAAIEGGHPCLVVFIDLDRFKTVNDTWGHDIGDVVLRTVAQRLLDTVRDADVVGRFGGDEFVVVCRDATADLDPVLVERIQARLREPVVWPGGTWVPAASIGVARVVPGDDPAGALRRADQAMLAVKRARHADHRRI